MRNLSSGKDSWARPLEILGFLASAAVAAAALRFAWHEPLLAAALLGGATAFVGHRFAMRRKNRRLLRSGDVSSVLDRWTPSLERIPYPSTMAPLMMATAFAANGWVERARAAIASAERGPAWDAAIEHRLFLDAMLLAFEGDRESALSQATRLSRLPLPPPGDALRPRVEMLREAVCALARAFAHESRAGDGALLEAASETSPLVHWAMRYAAAIVAVHEGAEDRARQLLSGAPEWPNESAFRAFHAELAARVGAAESSSGAMASDVEPAA